MQLLQSKREGHKRATLLCILYCKIVKNFYKRGVHHRSSLSFSIYCNEYLGILHPKFVSLRNDVSGDTRFKSFG